MKKFMLFSIMAVSMGSLYSEGFYNTPEDKSARIKTEIIDLIATGNRDLAKEKYNQNKQHLTSSHANEVKTKFASKYSTKSDLK
jgi:hypothetical protein